jgi:hypothetical protein
MCRRPYKDSDKSNGHGRGVYGYASALPGNLFIKSAKTHSEDEILDEFFRLAKNSGYDYGIVVERIAIPSDLSALYTDAIDDILEKFRQGYSELSGKTSLMPPLLVYRLYKDGRKEYLRECGFTSINAQILHRIVMTGSDEYVYNYSVSGQNGVGIVVQSTILIDGMELEKLRTTPEKLPFLSRP